MSARPSHGPRNLSATWDRLKPSKQDQLESMGYPSKGDNRLLDPRLQDAYYNKIVARYMQFCAQHAKSLEVAHVALYHHENASVATPLPSRQSDLTEQLVGLTISPPPTASGDKASPVIPAPATELSTILTALRKLREGLRASSSAAPSPVFSQRVHVFNIRLAILALHHESYHQALLHLLFVLHTREHPLPRSELVEMTSYFILDLAARQDRLGGAYATRYNSKITFGYDSRNVDTLLRCIATSDWVNFWRMRRKVDGHMRAILFWQVQKFRKLVLKTIGRTYLNCDLRWILSSTSGSELSWEELVKHENIGWIRDGDNIIIRKPKTKDPPANANANAKT